MRIIALRTVGIAVLCLSPLMTGLLIRLDPSQIGLKLDDLDYTSSFLWCLFDVSSSRDAFLRIIRAPYFDYAPSLLHICSNLSREEDLKWLVECGGLDQRLLADCIQLCPVATPSAVPEVNLLAAHSPMFSRWPPEFFFKALQAARTPRMETDLSRWINDPSLTAQHFEDAEWNESEDQLWKLITVDLAENAVSITDGLTRLASLVAGPFAANRGLSHEQIVLRLLNFCMLKTVYKESGINGPILHVLDELIGNEEIPFPADAVFERAIRELARTVRDWHDGYQPDVESIALELLDHMPPSQWTGQLLLNLLHVTLHATPLSKTAELQGTKDAIARRYLEVATPLTKDLCTVMKLMKEPSAPVSGLSAITEYLHVNQDLASDAYKVCPDMLSTELKLSLPLQMRLAQTLKRHRKPRNSRFYIMIRERRCKNPREVLETLLMGTWELLTETEHYNVELVVKGSNSTTLFAVRPFTAMITLVLRAFMNILEFYQPHKEADGRLCIVPTLQMHPSIVRLFAFFVGAAAVYRVPQQFRICGSYFDRIRDDSLPIEAQSLAAVYKDHSSIMHDGAISDTLKLDDQCPFSVVMGLSMKGPRACSELPLPMELESVVNGLLNSLQSFRAGLNLALDAENYSLGDLNDLLFGLKMD